MERVGRENGILFSFGSRIGSTRDCHRMLLEFARPKGWEVEKALIEKIFEWHFERDADITSRQALAKIVVDAGVVSSEDDVLVFLEGEERAQEVDELVAQAKAKDVKHVPTFEIHGRRIEGAEDTSAFYEALAGAKDEESTVGVNGNAC